jgi:PAS domain S-box-containing protein
MGKHHLNSSGSEVGFQALFEYATIGILVINVEGSLEMMNPCAEKLFGYSNDELIGKPVEMLMPQAFRQKHVRHRNSYFEKPKARPMGYGLNLMACNKKGEEFPVEISLAHYKMGNKQLAVAFITDITKLQNAYNELEIKVKERTLELTGSLLREKQLNELKSRFVSMASHEFRTPLSTILSSISLVELYKNAEQKDKRTKHIERIKSSVRNLIDILNDFLSLDKLEQSKVEVAKEPFDLHVFCENIIEEETSILKSGQCIDFSYLGENKINQDKKILRYIITNLLSNASKYSGEDQAIHFSANIANNHLSIKIEDEGIGIPEAEQEHLFTTFFRASNASKIQGTGLGLNIVKKYTELLNGTISFTSKENTGTTFTAVFPLNTIA